VGSYLIEAELLIVVWTDPFAGIESAFFKRGINITPGDLLRHAAELLQNAPGESADTHLQTLQIVECIDLLAEPTAHLTTGVSDQKRVHIVFLEELIEHFLAATERVPALVQALIGSESHRRSKGERRIFAEIII
jgi:hypothetical protein